MDRVIVLFIALLMCGCAASRSVMVRTEGRTVEVRENGYFWLGGEWTTVIDDQCATDTRTKKTIDSLGLSAISATAAWLIK